MLDDFLNEMMLTAIDGAKEKEGTSVSLRDLVTPGKRCLMGLSERKRRAQSKQERELSVLYISRQLYCLPLARYWPGLETRLLAVGAAARSTVVQES